MTPAPPANTGPEAAARALIPAATILLVRDAGALEVLMVERHHQIDFASGALVFPGGKLCADDADPRWADHDQSGLPAATRALGVAAIREAFEESGLLLARPRATPDRFATADELAPLLAHRDAIAAGADSFLARVTEAGLVLALTDLIPFAHWITPKGMPKRFDTQFYLAVAPDAQLACGDGREAVDATWVRPAEALAAAAAGQRTIIFPTRLNLALLGRCGSCAEAVSAARARTIVTVEPEIELRGQEPWLTIPAAAGYDVCEEPLEGNRP